MNAGALQDDAAAMLRAARAAYATDKAACAQIDDLERRLREPLRLALAGMVKAGKSTLLNAILGEEIAPTDAGECTRVVTWYRYSATPSVTMRLKTGEERRMPVRRVDDRLVLDLGETPADDVALLEVGWPLGVLKSMILIDTPGIASLSGDTSARAARFLAPEESPSSADAVLYLMRHLHPSDVKFLEAFRDTAAGVWQTICAIGVLSRADEIGSGRIDSLLSARKVARRYEREGELAALALGVLPVAGLVAQGAKTLRESEYTAFCALAAMERLDREKLLVSADRFVAPTDTVAVTPAERSALLARFGMYGVRLATALIRGGAASSSALAEQMVAQSGLNELQQFVRDQFRTRATTLKVRGILMALENLLRDRPRDGLDEVRAGIERISAGAHALRELSVLATARGEGLPLAEADAAEAQVILGLRGPAAHTRLGMPEESTPHELRERAETLTARWRRLSESPLTDRAAVAVCRTVLRSLAEIASEVGSGGRDRAGADVMLPGGPVDGLRQDAAPEGQQDDRAPDDEQRAQRLPALAQRDQLG